VDIGRTVAAETTVGKARSELGEETWRALAGAKGFVVESPIGPLGTVEDIRYSRQPRRPELLVVHVGGSERGKVVLVPTSSVLGVVAAEHRVVLRPGILLRR
jgi:hypothetical protein